MVAIVIGLGRKVRVFAWAAPVDQRKSFWTLSALVESAGHTGCDQKRGSALSQAASRFQKSSHQPFSRSTRSASMGLIVDGDQQAPGSFRRFCGM